MLTFRSKTVGVIKQCLDEISKYYKDGDEIDVKAINERLESAKTITECIMVRDEIVKQLRVLRMKEK